MPIGYVMEMQFDDFLLGKSHLEFVAMGIW